MEKDLWTAKRIWYQVISRAVFERIPCMQSTTNLNLDTRYENLRKITLNITTWIDIDFLKPLKHFTGVKWDFKRMIFWVAGEYYFRQYIYLKVYLSQKCNICTIISLHFKKICSFTGKFLNLVSIDYIKILWLPILADNILPG